jgi:DNA polymerase III subunit delta
MAELKPAYLIHGEDEARIDAARRRMRARGQAEAADASLEVLRGEQLTAEATVAAIGALTLGAGRRYLLADGVERWKDADVKQVVTALADIPPDTVILLLCSGDAPAALVKAVEKAGGEVHSGKAPKPAEYPRWTIERARELGVGLDRDAAQALVAQAARGERNTIRQHTLVRELEKLALFVGDGATIDVEAVDAVTTSAVESRVFELADAIIEGDSERAVRVAEDLRDHGDDIMHILFTMLRQLRNCHRAWALLAAGTSAKDIQADLRQPPWVAKQTIAQARRADPERVERALDLLADLDWQIRGGGDLDVESALTLTVTAASSDPRAVA